MLAKYLRTTLTCAACILLTACNLKTKTPIQMKVRL